LETESSTEKRQSEPTDYSLNQPIDSFGSSVKNSNLFSDQYWGWSVENDVNISSSVFATDDAGNSFVSGRFSGNISFGTIDLSTNDSDKIFVAKMNNSGSWHWAIDVEHDNGYRDITDITVDSNDSIYVTGRFTGNITFGTYSLIGDDQNNSIFVAKLNITGSWQWAQNSEGGKAVVYDLDLDSNGHAYITGRITSPNVLFGNTNLSSTGGFITKITTYGIWDWAILPVVDNFSLSVHGIAVNSMGEVYCLSTYDDRVIVTKFSSLGVQLWNNSAYTTAPSTSTPNYNVPYTEAATYNSIDVDSTGAAYIFGGFTGSITFDSFSLNNSDNTKVTIEGFIAKISNLGVYQWASLITGSGNWFDTLRTDQIIIDSYDDLFVVGTHTSSITFGFNDRGVFLAKYDTSSGQPIWAISADDMRWSRIGIDDFGNIYLSLQHYFEGQFTDFIVVHQDNDMDGILNMQDFCFNGLSNWIPNGSSDYDSDGCRDFDEDLDDDNDLVGDINDSCPKGQLNWTSNSSVDFDSDGCRDSDEDLDDDNDGFSDDEETTGVCVVYSDPLDNNSIPPDMDSDLICDALDADIDGDGYDNTVDSFPYDFHATTDTDDDGLPDDLTGNSSTGLVEDDDDDDDGFNDSIDPWPLDNCVREDHDGDGLADYVILGCQTNILEDGDDDNDNKLDQDDFCPTGKLNWLSGAVTDNDNDGCRDSDEDMDDDNDGLLDTVDLCPRGYVGWVSNPSVDQDSDGCHDLIEDNDDDNDGVSEPGDQCPNTPANVTVDAQGCPIDSDSDGVADYLDNCSNTPIGVIVDTQGCPVDSDGDGVPDYLDEFPSDSSETTDSDSDGVGDNSDAFPNDGNETLDSDGDGVGDNSDAFPNDGNETLDSDGDGVGDNSDAFPNDGNETLDSDGDGVGDNSDAFPNDGNETLDSDGDGVGDNSDKCSETALEQIVEPDGCVESSASFADQIPTVTVGVSVLGIIAITTTVILLRKRKDEEITKEFIESNTEEFVHNINEQEENGEPQIEENPSDSNLEHPPIDNEGKEGDDGYYWLEWPSDSGKWYYRGLPEDEWRVWEI